MSGDLDFHTWALLDGYSERTAYAYHQTAWRLWCSVWWNKPGRWLQYATAEYQTQGSYDKAHGAVRAYQRWHKANPDGQVTQCHRRMVPDAPDAPGWETVHAMREAVMQAKLTAPTKALLYLQLDTAQRLSTLIRLPRSAWLDTHLYLADRDLTFPLTEPAIELLTESVKARPPASADAPLFPSNRGKGDRQRNARSVRHRWEDVRRTLPEWAQLNPNDVRRAWAQRMAAAGVPYRHIAAALDVSQWTLQRYLLRKR